MPHTNFPKVTWVIFVKVDPVVVHASSIPAAAWVLAVLTDAAVAVAHVAPEFLGLPQSGCMAVAERKEGGAHEESFILTSVVHFPAWTPTVSPSSRPKTRLWAHLLLFPPQPWDQFSLRTSGSLSWTMILDANIRAFCVLRAAGLFTSWLSEGNACMDIYIYHIPFFFFF